MLQMFDFPDPNVHAANRVETTTPMQKLFALNNPFVVQRAAEFAERLQHESDVEQQIRSAYLILFARSADEDELQLGQAFLANAEPERLKQYAQILLASNEMMNLD